MTWLNSIPLSFTLEACWHDCRTREIPNGISARIAITALLATGLSFHPLFWSDALLGMLIGFVCVLPFSWLGGIGGGDLKLVAALGGWLGPVGAIALLFWSALFGTASAVIAGIRRRPDFPYLPAIAAGLFTTLLFPGILQQLLAALRSVAGDH